MIKVEVVFQLEMENKEEIEEKGGRDKQTQNTGKKTQNTQNIAYLGLSRHHSVHDGRGNKPMLCFPSSNGHSQDGVCSVGMDRASSPSLTPL